MTPAMIQTTSRARTPAAMPFCIFSEYLCDRSQRDFPEIQLSRTMRAPSPKANDGPFQTARYHLRLSSQLDFGRTGGDCRSRQRVRRGECRSRDEWSPGRRSCARGWWNRGLGTIAKLFDTDHWELYDVNNHAADSLPDTGDGDDAEQSGASQ